MNKLLTVGLVLVVLGAIAIGLDSLRTGMPQQEPDASPVQAYTSPIYGLSFEYPSSYYLEEYETGSDARPIHSIVLVEDTDENRALLRGESTIAREGPTSITVDIYPNQDRLPAEDWVQSDTNWTIRTSPSAPFGAGSIAGVSYTWSGLYEGRSVIVTAGGYAYVFSVTWMTPEDEMLRVFDQLLRSVSLDSQQ